jgi:cell shape-determining protein MreC
VILLLLAMTALMLVRRLVNGPLEDGWRLVQASTTTVAAALRPGSDRARTGTELGGKALHLRDLFVNDQKERVRVPAGLMPGVGQVVAQVLGGTHHPKELRVGVGARTGVRKGARVLFGEELVGMVERVEAESCTVRLVTDRSFRAGGEVISERGDPVRLALEGHPDGSKQQLRIKLRSTYTELEPGLEVRVLPLGGPGDAPLRLGRIQRETSRSGDEITVVEPEVELLSLLFVAVCLDEPDGPVRDHVSRPLDRQVARVVRDTDSAPFRRSILVDRGSSHGVVEGSAVVANGSLVGRVVGVRHWSSRVQLVSDPAWTFSATFVPLDGEDDLLGAVGLQCSFQPRGLCEEPRLSSNSGEERIGSTWGLLLSAPSRDGIPPGLPIAFTRRTTDGALDTRLLLDPDTLDEVEIVSENRPDGGS